MYLVIESLSGYTKFVYRKQRGGWELLMIGRNIGWDKVRATPVETPPNALHVSDDRSNLKPGDHIEIQFRISRQEFYGTVTFKL